MITVFKIIQVGGRQYRRNEANSTLPQLSAHVSVRFVVYEIPFKIASLFSSTKNLSRVCLWRSEKASHYTPLRLPSHVFTAKKLSGWNTLMSWRTSRSTLAKPPCHFTSAWAQLNQADSLLPLPTYPVSPEGFSPARPSPRPCRRVA